VAFKWGSKTKKGGKSRLNLHGTILERKSIGSNPKKKKKEAKEKRSRIEETT